MHISIIDPKTFDAFVRRIAPQTTIPVTRLKTAIAKAFGFDHIKAFESALAPCTAAQPAKAALSHDEQYILSQLAAWLEDNVDQGTEIAFDNDEEVYSEHALSALNNLLGQADTSQDACEPELLDSVKRSLERERETIERTTLSLAEVDSVDELDHEHYTQAEDAFIVESGRLFDVDNMMANELEKGLLLLKSHGLTNLAHALRSAHLQYHVMEYLRKNT